MFRHLTMRWEKWTSRRRQRSSCAQKSMHRRARSVYILNSPNQSLPSHPRVATSSRPSRTWLSKSKSYAPLWTEIVRHTRLARGIHTRTLRLPAPAVRVRPFTKRIRWVSLSYIVERRGRLCKSYGILTAMLACLFACHPGSLPLAARVTKPPRSARNKRSRVRFAVLRPVCLLIDRSHRCLTWTAGRHPRE